MIDSHSASLLRAAFELGRAQNEFEWHLVNVLVGGAPGQQSYATLDRIQIHVAVLIARQMLIDFQDLLNLLRGDWADSINMEPWKDNYDAAEKIFGDQRSKGKTPSEIG